MRIGVFSVFAASPKDPLGEAFGKLRTAFETAELGQPQYRFIIMEAWPRTSTAQAAGAPKPVSSIARVLKRYPGFERFVRTAPGHDGGPLGTMLTNIAPDGMVEQVEPEALLAIAAGVPRSFPFRKIWLHVTAPGFSGLGNDLPEQTNAQALANLLRAGVDVGGGHPTRPGIALQDAWWVNGRTRNMAALRVIEAQPEAKQLPPTPPEVAALMAGLGKVRKTLQVPLMSSTPNAEASLPSPDVKARPAGEAVLRVMRAWRARLPGLAETLPHDVVVPFTAPPRVTAGAPYGPRKPALERFFGAMGYGIRGETGGFVVRRRTAMNLTLELRIDVGTWDDHITATLVVIGMMNGAGFKAAMSLPPCRQAPHATVRGVELYGQVTVGTAERWEQLAENLGALMQQLDAALVPEVEAVAGPTPAWFKPDAAA